MNDLNRVSGAYINLDRSVERRNQCEMELRNHDLEAIYSRFPATDGVAMQSQYPESKHTPPRLGCWLSHIELLTRNQTQGQHLHILEDDFRFTQVSARFLNNVEDYLKNLPEWDIIFLDCDLAGMHSVANMKKLIEMADAYNSSGNFSFLDANVTYGASTTSYLVNSKSKAKLLNLLKEGLASQLPIDLYLRSRIRSNDLRAYVAMPFITTVADSFLDSTILGNINDANPSIMFATMYRQSLAAGANAQNILGNFQRLLNKSPPISSRGMIYAHLVAHFVSKEYTPY